MARRPNLIALATDFGTKDPYVGIMKGVILGINPRAAIVDLSHEIPPQAVMDACLLLSGACSYFPHGTVFVTVVDPGVGTDRAILAVETDHHLFLAPDNGVLGFLRNIRRMVRVENSKYFLKPVSNTFHGRDIFAPVVARLAGGLDIGKLGPRVRTMERIHPPAPRVLKNGTIAGQVLTADQFGNLITNIPGDRLAGAVEVRLGDIVVGGLSTSYAGAPEGELLAIVGSTGLLEISVNRGNAQTSTGVRAGDAVQVYNRRRP